MQKARMACFNSAHRIKDHFVDVTEMIEIGKGGQRPVEGEFKPVEIDGFRKADSISTEFEAKDE